MTKKRKFPCVRYAQYQFLCGLARFDIANHGVRQPVQPHTFYSRLLVFDKTLAQHHFAVRLLCRSEDKFVLLPWFNAQTDIFAVMNC